MEKINFNSNATPSVGVEIELALVDMETMALTSAVNDILGKLPPEYEGKIKPELMQCYLEINSETCSNINEIEADLIVAAIGQAGDLTGMEELDNGKGLINATGHFQWPDRENIFVAGDIIKPHLLTTAVGQASIAAVAINQYLTGQPQEKLPKVNVHHFSLLEKLKESGHEPTEYPHVQTDGTNEADWAVHNYEDRAKNQIVPADELFLGHWANEPRFNRQEVEIGSDAVLGHFGERIVSPNADEAREEADRCMSCGMCFECDNCVIFCPQDAVHRVKKADRTVGRYVDTDYTRCIGCHICADVCPTGYIKMGLGE